MASMQRSAETDIKSCIMQEKLQVDLGQLDRIAAESEGVLTGLWREIGLTGEEQQEEMAGVDAAMAKLCHDIIAEQENYQAHLEEEIHKTKTECLAIYHELAIPSELSGYSETEKDMNLLERLHAVESYLKKAEDMKRERMEDFEVATHDIAELHQVLGLEVPDKLDVITDDISSNRLERIHLAIESAHAQLQERKQEVQSLVEDIADLLALLCFSTEDIPEDSLDYQVAALAIPDEFGIDENLEVTPEIELERQAAFVQLSHVDSIRDLKKRKEELLKEKEQRQCQLRSLAVSITAIWDRFSISEEERQAFFGEHCGLGLETIEACKHELHELQIMKQSRMKDLIQDAQEQLYTLWDQCFISEEERHDFEPGFSTYYNDEILEALECEIRHMTNKKEEMKPILAIMSRRQKLLDEKAEYERMLLDPDRFRIPKRMIVEEKMRKRIAKLPKVEESLLNAVKQWEVDHGPFYLNGERYLNSQNDQSIEQNYGPSQKTADAIRSTPRASSHVRHYSSGRALSNNESQDATQSSLKKPRARMRHHSSASLSRYGLRQ